MNFTTATTATYLDAIALDGRDATITELRRLLKAATGRTWSVTGGRGTAWGWITIHAPKARRDEFGNMTDADREALTIALGEGQTVHRQGHTVPASSDHRAEVLRRAAGLDFTQARPYWD